jgi:hypothetical protein
VKRRKPLIRLPCAGDVELVRCGVGRSCAAVNQFRESRQRRRETASSGVEEAHVWPAKGNSARNGENRKVRSRGRLRTCGLPAGVNERGGENFEKTFGSSRRTPLRNWNGEFRCIAGPPSAKT